MFFACILARSVTRCKRRAASVLYYYIALSFSARADLDAGAAASRRHDDAAANQDDVCTNSGGLESGFAMSSRHGLFGFGAAQRVLNGRLLRVRAILCATQRDHLFGG